MAKHKGHAETRARQAEIAAGVADVRMRQVEKNAADSAGIDGVDAPEVGVEANTQQQKIDNAEQREAQAEGEE